MKEVAEMNEAGKVIAWYITCVVCGKVSWIPVEAQQYQTIKCKRCGLQTTIDNDNREDI